MKNENKVDRAHRLLKLEIDQLNERLEEIISSSSNSYDGYLLEENDGFVHSIIGDSDPIPVPPLIKKSENEKGYVATTLGQYDEVLFVHGDGSKVHGVVSICAWDWIEVTELDQFDAQTSRKFRFDAHYLPPFFKKVYDYGVG